LMKEAFGVDVTPPEIYREKPQPLVEKKDANVQLSFFDEKEPA
jgi:hypothetical protein